MNRVQVQADFTPIFAESLRFDYEYAPEEQTLRLSAENLGRLFPLLAEDERLGFDYLRDLTAKEQPEGTLHLVYNFLSLKHRHTLTVVATLPLCGECELPEVASATCRWNSANWQEREVYDLFGIGFSGHPDLRRIFLDEAVTFHPLRKRFQLEMVKNLRDLGEAEVAFTREAREQMTTEESRSPKRGNPTNPEDAEPPREADDSPSESKEQSYP